MIPIIYGPQEKNFTSNGLGRLTDCVEFTVTEERNGRYEAEFKYPIDGVHFDDLVEGNIVSCTHDEQGDRQPFKIYQHTAPDLNGVVTFYAHHISYDLANVILRPFSATSAASALEKFGTEAMTEQPFSFWTDKASGGSFEITVPSPAKAMLGGVQGSILDAFGGGEYEWDNYLVKLYQDRGSDSGVTIRYGKNLMALQHTYDTLGLYNAVIPYWVGQDEEVVYGGIVTGSGGIGQSNYWTDENLVRITNENNVDFTFDFTISQTTTMDLSDEFDDEPTTAELEARALQIMNSNEPWAPKENIKVDFVALWQTEEYANVAPLERVRLCDTVTVYYPALNVNATAKVITTKYDVLSDRYSSIELGAAKTSFAQVLTAETEEKLAEVPSKSMMQEAIDHATALITGGLGGHVVFRYDASGKPTEILVMDTEDENTAVHVLRINVNGIGFSNTGPSGIFNTAWTLDGSFVADFITAGTLSANRIKGGTLTLGGPNNGNGSMTVQNASGKEVAVLDNTGLYLYDYTYSVMQTLNRYDAKTLNLNYVDGGGPLSFHTSKQVGLLLQSESRNEVLFTGVASAKLGDYTRSYKRIRRGSGKIYGTGLTGVPANLIESVAGSSQAQQDASDKYFNAYEIENGIDYACIREDAGGATSGIEFYATMSGDYLYYVQGARPYGVSDYDTTHARLMLNSESFKLCAGGHTLFLNSYRWPDKFCYDGKEIQVQSSSSKRYKHDIAEMTAAELDPHRLYRLNAKQFVFNDGHPLQYADMEGQTLPGFVAEDVAEIYPAAVIHDHEGKIENWDERRIIPGMLQLIQEQKEEIDELKDRLARLEHVVEALTNDMR